MADIFFECNRDDCSECIEDFESCPYYALCTSCYWFNDCPNAVPDSIPSDCK